MGTATATYWPTMSDYQQAVQSPTVCFPDAELQGGTPVTNKLGLPKPICGQFASVYEIETGAHRYAIKCFLRNIPDQHDRYARISQHLSANKTGYFVTFEYKSDGIRVQGTLYPLVKMEWIAGHALNEFISQNLQNRTALLDLEKSWLELLDVLIDVNVAHGDLQHGNVLVLDDGTLRLIDYDGMWVPALKGKFTHETGHPDYQSPLRSHRDFHADIDLFSGAVVQIALRALSQKPDLWAKYNNGDNLLFKRSDYLNIDSSPLIPELKALGDDVINEKLALVIQGCKNLKKLTRAAKGAAKAKKAPAPKVKKKLKLKPQPTPQPRATPQPASVSAAAPPPPTPAPAAATVAAAASVATQSQTQASPLDPAVSSPLVFHVVLHAFVLAPVAFPSLASWVGFFAREDSSLRVHEMVLAAGTILGALSITSLFVFKKYHFRLSGIFFGLMVLLSVYDLLCKLLTIGLPGSLGENLVEYGPNELLLLLSVLGWNLRSENPAQP